MASDLKWRTGFGWGPVLVFAVFAAGVWLGTGTWRWGAAAMAILAALYMLVQYRKWNGRGWTSVHYRAMLVWAQVAGWESGAAEREGREFDRLAACRQLAIRMSGPGKELNVEAMLTALQEEQGIYLASLVERHREDLLPGAEDERLQRVLAELRKALLGPELVICNVIENTHGSLEAARYVLALADGTAG